MDLLIVIQFSKFDSRIIFYGMKTPLLEHILCDRQTIIVASLC